MFILQTTLEIFRHKDMAESLCWLLSKTQGHYKTFQSFPSELHGNLLGSFKQVNPGGLENLRKV